MRALLNRLVFRALYRVEFREVRDGMCTVHFVGRWRWVRELHVHDFEAHFPDRPA